jgi:WD40 repeat protein
MNFAKHWAASLDDYAIDLAWSPDGSLLAAASTAGAITLYDAATGTVKHTLAGHADGTNCLAWMPPMQMSDVRNQKSDLTGGNLTSDLRPLTSLILATGGQDGCVRFWDTSTGAQTAEAKLGHAWVEHLCWASSGAAATSPHSDRAGAGAAPGYLLFAAAGKKLAALRPDGSLAHAFPDAPKTISALAVKPVAGVADPGPGSSLATKQPEAKP